MTREKYINDDQGNNWNKAHFWSFLCNDKGKLGERLRIGAQSIVSLSSQGKCCLEESELEHSPYSTHFYLMIKDQMMLRHWRNWNTAMFIHTYFHSTFSVKWFIEKNSGLEHSSFFLLISTQQYRHNEELEHSLDSTHIYLVMREKKNSGCFFFWNTAAFKPLLLNNKRNGALISSQLLG